MRVGCRVQSGFPFQVTPHWVTSCMLWFRSVLDLTDLHWDSLVKAFSLSLQPILAKARGGSRLWVQSFLWESHRESQHTHTVFKGKYSTILVATC